MEVGVSGEEARVHVEDAANGGTVEAHGGETVFNGEESRERSGTDVWV